MRIAAGICAAGGSSRMGFDKLATPLPDSAQKGDTLLGRALSASRDMDQVVALPNVDHEYFQQREAIVGDTATVSVEGAFSDSLQALAAYALEHGYDGLLVQLADMPAVTSEHVAQVCDVFAAFGGARIVQAASTDGARGHPVIFPAATLSAFASLNGDVGAREIVAKYGAKLVQIGTSDVFSDVDTPEAWAALTAS